MISPVVSDELTPSAIEDVTAIVRALDRGIRSRRLYAENNPTYLRHQQDLVSLLTQYLTAEDALTLMVEPYALKIGEATVYQNENQQESFAFRLFSDGIRSLAFETGLQESEITEFLSVISARQTDRASENADAITLFWEKQFEHIRYSVADSILDEPTIEQKSTDDTIEELLDPEMTMYQGADSPSSALEDEEVSTELKPTLDPTSVGDMFQDRCVLAPEELAKIQIDLAESDKSERLILDFVDMLLAVLQEEDDSQEYDRIVTVLGTALDTNLRAGQFSIARMVMEQVHAFPKRASQANPDDPALLRRILKILWPAARVELFLQSCNQETVGGTEDLETLISLLDPNTIPQLLKQLGTIIDMSRRRILCRGIARLHKGDLGLFLPMLSSKETDTVRSGLYILSLMKNDKIVDLLPSLIQHTNQTIRKEAISILRNFRNPKAHRLLMTLLQDPGEDIRILTLRILAGANERDVARPLLETINRKEFKEKSLQERKAYFHAVAKIVGDDFIPYLQNILRTKNWFGSPELNDMYQCATFSLSVLGTPLAREALQTAQKTGNRHVRKYSEAALRLLEGAQSQ